MKRIASILFLLCFIPQANAQNLYEDALTAASYAYSHSKKAHGANNVFHTQEYADKAIEALEKVEELADKCGCTDANETAYEAKTNMVSSLDQDTYERSRYYAKQAKDLGPKLLEQLTDCQANNGSSESYVVDAASDEEEEAIAVASEEVAQKQRELAEQRRQLEIEQQKLQQQIAEQQKAKAEFEAQRAAELKEQTVVKAKAEQALQKLESALQELSIAFDDESIFESQKDYLRSENDLQNETLNDTKSFYVNRAKELTKSAMQQFAGYTEN
ncbi:hypothetical protein SAMN04487910_4111 [Aquimarina amphilecti]|uniref:DUF4398 domain-containing protein n=1 Tax=Aquimarina amphilecti TaxID=1038014 RepID=A0A1H7VMM4_AQUAM|nr:hypothetical protein [Aquimarina amphilecti]SEM10496.1 hypothetical protein SAMN04487910_4111 [Aquimarina amphilecti]